MQYLWLVAVSIALACLQHGCLASWTIAPDLPLALAAWAMIHGDDDGVVLRPWLIGLCRDLVDPGTQDGGDHFYLIAYGMMGLVFMPLRAWLFRSRATARGGWAAHGSVVLARGDARLGGMHMRLLPTVLVALATALAAIALGWLLAGLPRPLRPVRAGGA